jgi:glycosyltransferase involved in cell wall biosynthesis
MIVIGYPVPFYGAGWRRIQYIIDCLSSKGYSVYVLSSISSSSLGIIRYKEYKFAKIIRLPLVFLDIALTKMLNILTFFLYTLLILPLLHVTILILSMPPEDPCLGSFLAGRLLNRKIIIDYRDEYGGSATRPVIYTKIPYYRAMLEQVDTIVAVTYSLIRNLQNNIRNKKIVYIPNVADTDIFKPSTSLMINKIRNKLGLNFDDFILTYTGILSPHTYNLPNVMQSLKILIKKGKDNIKLLIAGKGPSKESILKIAKILKIDDHLIYLGVVKDPYMLSEIISSSDIGLVPYINNTLLKNCVSMKFYEYCSCGIPVIATAYEDSEIAHIILNNRLGLVAEPDNPLDLSIKIEKIYNNYNYRKELGKNARIFIEKYHSKDSFCAKYSSLINSLQRMSR